MTANSIEPAAERCTCTACPLLCDDITVTAADVDRACRHGRDALRAALADADTPHPEALEDGVPVSRARAIQSAATLLASARRVLVTGLANGPLEAVAAAGDVAELLGAAVDAGLPESSRAAGPTIARTGEVTAAWEELRDRADLVIFWCCDPAVSHPRFLERFVAPPPADGRNRRTIAVGDAAVLPVTATHRHLPLAGALAVEAARCLHLHLLGRDLPANVAEPLAAVCAPVLEAIRSASCVAIVTNDADDEVGLEGWSIVHLVRAIAHAKPAFQAPLGAGLAAGGANGAGATAACTWRYGAAGAIDRADRMGGRFLPGESDARRLIDRGEVDAVLILGRLADTLERSVGSRGPALSQVRICGESWPDAPPAGRSVVVRCASGIATAGTVLREDGRRIVLRPCRQSAAPQIADLLAGLAETVRQSLAASAPGDFA